jgi:hypothetical protein
MGLLKTAAKVAVASSVHGRVQRRQQSRWAAQDQAAAQAATSASASSAPQPPPPAAAATSGNDTNELLAQLKQLGELRDAGVLTDNEFQAQKARILARQG